MKFVVSYRERRGEFDPAAAQRRAARLLAERSMLPGLTIHHLLARIGGGGGYAVVEAERGEDLQALAGLFSAYDCRIEPVIDVPSAVVPSGKSSELPAADAHGVVPDLPSSEPHEGAFSDDDVYDTED